MIFGEGNSDRWRAELTGAACVEQHQFALETVSCAVYGALSGAALRWHWTSRAPPEVAGLDVSTHVLCVSLATLTVDHGRASFTAVDALGASRLSPTIAASRLSPPGHVVAGTGGAGVPALLREVDRATEPPRILP